MKDGSAIRKESVRIPVFSDIDVLSCEQSITKLENIGFFCEFKEKFVGLIIDKVLGIIKEN
jgi:hypothetical protein